MAIEGVEYCEMCGAHPMEHGEGPTPKEELYRAAPELYAALKFAEIELLAREISGPLLLEIKAALKKARGEQ